MKSVPKMLVYTDAMLDTGWRHPNRASGKVGIFGGTWGNLRTITNEQRLKFQIAAYNLGRCHLGQWWIYSILEGSGLIGHPEILH